nr:immunoglobulin light chain junction region [Macaca mulatta]MOX22468.1 immunoglobulin light chain junction region [Macaca mulatta]
DYYCQSFDISLSAGFF